jgi:hypothetical protein
MAQAKMPNGLNERGTAKQRHIARKVSSLEGVSVVISFSSGGIAISLEDGAEVSKLCSIIEEHDASIETEDDPIYSTGGLGLEITP